MNEIFEKKVFGSIDNTESDTKKETEILENVYRFFNDVQSNIADHLPQITKSFEILRDNKEEYPDVLMNDDNVLYRFVTLKSLTDYYKISFIKPNSVIKQLNDKSIDYIYVGDIYEYGTRNELSSWTTDPNDEGFYWAFRQLALLKTFNNKYTVLTDEFSNKIKPGEDFKENEVVIVNNKNPYPCKLHLNVKSKFNLSDEEYMNFIHEFYPGIQLPYSAVSVYEDHDGSERVDVSREDLLKTFNYCKDNFKN